MSSDNRRGTGDDPGSSGESGEETRSPLYRRLLGVMKRHSERLLHAQRRRWAVARLQRYPEPSSILLICGGNICRSPYAAAALRKRLNGFLGKQYQIQSAGLIGPGRPSPDEAIQVARSRDIDLSAHRSQLITAELVHEADLIIVMDQHQTRVIQTRFPIGRRHVCVLGDLDPGPIPHRRIEDPIEQSIEVYRRTYERIDRCIDQLVRAVTKQIAGSR